MSTRFDIITSNVEQTYKCASILGSCVASPLTIALDGELGAGKTHVVRGFMQGFDAEYAAWVRSPTYALCNQYPSDPPVYHVDAYRLAGFDDLESIGFWEFEGMGVILVEWASRIPDVLESCSLRLQLEGDPGTDKRIITVTSHDEQAHEIAGRWRQRLLDADWGDRLRS